MRPSPASGKHWNGFELTQLSSDLTGFHIQDIVYNQDTDEATLTWKSIPGRTYRVLVSNDLEGDPVTTWLEIDDSTAKSELTIFTDMTLVKPVPERRFYVVQELAPAQ